MVSNLRTRHTSEETNERNYTMSKDTVIDWTIKGLDGKPFMAVRGYRTEACYQLYEWRVGTRDGVRTEDWFPVELYPWTLSSAMERVRRFMLQRQGDTTDEVDKMVKTLRAIDRRLIEAITEAEAGAR